ncbi:Mov34/MPN/PAD-1 family protein [Undibacterium sp. Di27W]|uniref:Mov34/MPN/PAD-1 family protein n=1 Tax=Undibacterium sp. Di27W TaxID=3413036 RepID=UPI003BF37F80
MVIDIHSHGFYPAFFSAKDNLDDKDTTKIAAVISFTKSADGEIHCNAKFRLCINGIFIPMMPKKFNNQIKLQEQNNDGTYY